MDEIVMTLEDLINYFAPPGNDIGEWFEGVEFGGNIVESTL